MNSIDDLLERTCKNMIKTLLACLDNATKGTIYRIGPMPKLQAVRVTSGVRGEGADEIVWGLPAVSDYNYPGKSWEEYRDRPDHFLEAMGWCVEKQRSWTAENPAEDVRSVRKQLKGELEDYYHMEPVLVLKKDFYGGRTGPLDYSLDWWGNPIWQDTEYVVVAVIKIHFLSDTLRRDDRSTRIIRELSRSLGTELLSLHLRETLLRAQKEFAGQRLRSAELLAHELRNTLIKFGFIFTAINAELGVLRQGWEDQLRIAFPEMKWKRSIMERLNEFACSLLPGTVDSGNLAEVCKTLISEQNELAAASLLPSQEEQWIKNKIRPKWDRLLAGADTKEAQRSEVLGLLAELKLALERSSSKDLAARVRHLPKDLCEKWVRIAYVYLTSDRVELLDEIIEFLEEPLLPLPQKKQMSKVLKSLKVLAEVVPDVEERANRILLSLKSGGDPDMSVPDNPDGEAGFGRRSEPGRSTEATIPG